MLTNVYLFFKDSVYVARLKGTGWDPNSKIGSVNVGARDLAHETNGAPTLTPIYPS